jgi:hypothetical protein
MASNSPRYLSFDHQYVETVQVTDSTALTNGVEANRFVKRTGAYPVAGGYAAGASVFRVYGQGELTDKGYQVDDGSTLVYEGQLNPSTTPLKPGVFPYQGLLSVVTTGIAIIEVDSAAAAFAVDDAVYATTAGRATKTAGAGTIVGRALDASAGTTAGQYIRVKLGNEAGA